MRLPTGQRLLIALGVAGWLAGGGAVASRGEEIVRLPPYIVEGKLQGRPWRYARFPGFEVLSRCADSKSRALAWSYDDAYRLAAAVLPRRFFGRFDVPTKLIFYSQSLWPAALEESAAEILRSGPLLLDIKPRPPPGAPTPFDAILAPDPLISRQIYGPPPGEVSATTFGPKPVFFEDMRLTDDDAIVIFTVAPAENSGYYKTFLKPTFVAQLLAARTPSLPSWFVAGFLDLYERLEFAGDTITLKPFVWLDPEHTEAAKHDPAAVVRTWLPLVELLSEDSSAATRCSTGTAAMAAAQLRLFLRWALDPADEKRREAFWGFLERACNEPVSEQLFQAAFGASSQEVAANLARYLRKAIRQPVTWNASRGDRPAMKFADASRADSARIRGDWERLQAAYVREAKPEFVETYRAKARNTLEQAYDHGERDPALLAVLGLCELDGGDTGQAEELLTRATRAGIVRPKAYLELARLKLAEFLGDPDRDGKLAPVQTAALTQLLASARAQSPQILETYQLALEIREHSAAPPQPADLAFLAGGAAAFPRSAELACRTAKIYLELGRNDEARALVEKATQLGASDGYLHPLADLRARLARRAP
ncbi:MAG TPA: hypothetical protein VG710_04715 [Opitutus sp.]|nr:hypothetical protein [Opitutus sp.]